jgi:hypothetical protein
MTLLPCGSGNFVRFPAVTCQALPSDRQDYKRIDFSRKGRASFYDRYVLFYARKIYHDSSRGGRKMKKTAVCVLTGLLVMAGAAAAGAGEQAPQKVVDLANTTLAAFGTDPVIVKSVRDENAKGKTLAQIQEKDKEWKAFAGHADYMKAMMDSECGRHIRKIQESSPYYAEIFVMDNQGANVAMSDKTSDYWQGDEDKFQKSYAGGAGAVFIDEVKFDDSSQTYQVQVSVPVLEGGKAIGAITFGIDVDKL